MLNRKCFEQMTGWGVEHWPGEVSHSLPHANARRFKSLFDALPRCGKQEFTGRARLSIDGQTLGKLHHCCGLPLFDVSPDSYSS